MRDVSTTGAFGTEGGIKWFVPALVAARYTALSAI